MGLSYFRKHRFARASVLLVLALALTVVVQTANAALTLETVKTWYWTSNTDINSVAVGDTDGDGQMEIVTGGYYVDGFRRVAQLCVWKGATLALENVKTWYWTGDTYINSVAIGDTDGDGQMEIVTGGCYLDGTRRVAQLCVWNGATLAVENVKTWYWTSSTYIYSVAVGDVDGDAQMEIVTGGSFYDLIYRNAQLCVWNGATLALENVHTYRGGYTDTDIYSVAVGDVDDDTEAEIVAADHYVYLWTETAHLNVWDGATLKQEGERIWKISNADTVFSQVVVGDVDGEGQTEIVTGGHYDDGTRWEAQLDVWKGATLATDGSTTWCWGYGTRIYSVAIGDVDGDAAVEIITGGDYNDGTREVAQVCVWTATHWFGFPVLKVENVKAWYWTSDTSIYSVAVGHVDGDGQSEIVTGGCHWDGTREVAQLCVWETGGSIL